MGNPRTASPDRTRTRPSHDRVDDGMDHADLKIHRPRMYVVSGVANDIEFPIEIFQHRHRMGQRFGFSPAVRCNSKASTKAVPSSIANARGGADRRISMSFRPVSRAC